MGSPPFCGVEERRAEIVPQRGGRRHQTTGWYGGLMAVSRGREGRAPRNVSVIESGSGYGKVVLPRMSKQPQRLWVYGVRKPKVVCLCAAMPMHGSAHCETMYNGRWTADRTHVAWVTCVEKGGQACITSYVCCPVLDNWLQKSNQIDWIIPMDGR
jgi:hypothetical protein